MTIPEQIKQEIGRVRYIITNLEVGSSELDDPEEILNLLKQFQKDIMNTAGWGGF